MTARGAPYLNRLEAGQRLAEALAGHRGEPVTVVALPRGGVPLGAVIADRLRAPLEVLVVRKIGAPGNREFGLAAIAEGGIQYLDHTLLEEFGITRQELQSEIRAQTEEVERQVRAFRGGRAPPDLADRTVILVDDGMATGVTVRAAVEALRLKRPRRLIVAVGVSSKEAAETLRRLADELVCPLVPSRLFAVGEWYREFPQVSDAEVLRLLERQRAGAPPPIMAA